MQQSQAIALGGKILVDKYGESELVKKLISEGAEMFARSLDMNSKYQADRGAVVLVARAGYDPFALSALLQDVRTYCHGCQQHPLALAHPGTF